MTTMRQRIVETFDQHVLRRSALSIGDGERVFRRLLGPNEYDHVLEIGTYRGVSAAAMALYCDKVTTIDLVDGRMEELGETFDRDAFWKAVGVREFIDLKLVKDNSDRDALIAQLSFDFAFIDGAPDIASITHDFEQVKRCGAVLFHDYARGNDVARFVHGLPGRVEPDGMFAFWRA